MSGVVTFTQERNIRHPERHLSRWQVSIDGKPWGFIYVAPDKSYLLHRGVYSSQPGRYFEGTAFEEAAKDACQVSGITYSSYQVKKE